MWAHASRIRTIPIRRHLGTMHRLTALRPTVLLLSLLTIVSLAFGTTAMAVAGVAAPAPAILAENAPEFSGPSAFRHVEALSVGIGSRVAGSPAQSQTHQYLMTQLQGMGYQVTLQPFS